MVNRIDPSRAQTLQIDGMKCTDCVATIEQALRALSGVENVTVDLDEGLAEVVGEVDPDELVRALSSTNYQARPVTRQ